MLSSLRFTVLASGSKANATIVCSEGEVLLVDCGLSYRELSRRMAAVNLHPSAITALLITHEHSDHVAGVPTFLRHHQVPVLTSLKTARSIGIPSHQVRPLVSGVPSLTEDFEILPIELSHDGVDPLGFKLTTPVGTLVHLTDTGEITTMMRTLLAVAHGVVLESNYEPELLQNCHYPPHVKARIASRQGHLSNDAARAVLQEVVHGKMQHIVLAHLSENSNSPDQVLQGIRQAFPPELHPRFSVVGRNGMESFLSIQADVAAAAERRESSLW